MLAVLDFVIRRNEEVVYVRVDEIDTARDFVDKSLARLRGVLNIILVASKIPNGVVIAVFPRLLAQLEFGG